MRLSAHFTLEEMIHSEIAGRFYIDNTPSDEIKTNLRALAGWLEPVRGLLGYPMIISSGYRCPALNKVIGGSVDSAHMRGLAVDFICPRFGSPRDVAEAIKSWNGTYDQLIWEWTWVHLAFGPGQRRQILTRNEHGYTKGLA